MSIIMFILFGIVVGVLARLVLPGRQNISLLMTTVLGVVGSLVGGMVATALGTGEYNELNIIGTIVAVATAAVLIAVVSGTQTRRHGHRPTFRH
jgi:uncharacterized membrane protein YeaQ/YmgE (transglycosylase-associated protein family)